MREETRGGRICKGSKCEILNSILVLVRTVYNIFFTCTCTSHTIDDFQFSYLHVGCT